MPGISGAGGCAASSSDPNAEVMENSAATAAPKLNFFIASPNTAPFIRSAGVNGSYLQDKLAVFATVGALGA
jgi:hypothetical protein